MFKRVWNLIISASLPILNRDELQVKEDTLHILGTLRRFNAPPHVAGLVDPAIRFLETTDWGLMWEQITGHKNNMVALEEHFQPIEEENCNG